MLGTALREPVLERAGDGTAGIDRPGAEIGGSKRTMGREDFREKAVIVTGASSGIGKALALRLADEGAWLALAARDAQPRCAGAGV